jgi:hypothetical protein
MSQNVIKTLKAALREAIPLCACAGSGLTEEAFKRKMQGLEALAHGKFGEREEYPIQGFQSIPWAVIAPHEHQAITNHGQTLERLAERGGTCELKTFFILNDLKIPSWDRTPTELEIKQAREYILKRVSMHNGILAKSAKLGDACALLELVQAEYSAADNDGSLSIPTVQKIEKFLDAM